jgi:hypothetical protein
MDPTPSLVVTLAGVVARPAVYYSLIFLRRKILRFNKW